MSIFVTSHAWKNSRANGSTLLVLLAICDFADDEGIAFPSVATLATKSRSSERTVQYALRELIALQELAIRRGIGPHGCNLYAVQVQNLRGANFAGVQSGSFGGAASCTQTTIEPSEKKENAGAGAGAGAGASAKPKRTPKPKVAEPVFDRLTGKFEGLEQKTIDQWAQANPGVDVPVEIMRASCWLIANPDKDKTRYLRFLAGWMNRAERRPARNGPDVERRPLSGRESNRQQWADRIAAAERRTRPHAQRGTDDAIDV